MIGQHNKTFVFQKLLFDVIYVELFAVNSLGFTYFTYLIIAANFNMLFLSSAAAHYVTMFTGLSDGLSVCNKL